MGGGISMGSTFFLQPSLEEAWVMDRWTAQRMGCGGGLLCQVPCQALSHLSFHTRMVLKPPPLHRRTPRLRVSNLPRDTQPRGGPDLGIHWGCVELQMSSQDTTWSMPPRGVGAEGGQRRSGAGEKKAGVAEGIPTILSVLG